MDWNIHFVFPQHILVGVLNLLCDRTDFVSSHWLFFFKKRNSKSQSENNQRQARESVNQALRESSENYEVMMMQELQSVSNRYEGRMGEHERRVAQVIGSDVRGAPRGKRSHMLHEHEVLLPAEQREKEFVTSQMHSELQPPIVGWRRTAHDREVQEVRILHKT